MSEKQEKKRSKVGGRQKGTPNRVTKELREKFRLFTDENFDEFASAWSRIKQPEEKAKVFIAATKFVLPSLQSVNIEGLSDKDKTIEEKLAELSQNLE